MTWQETAADYFDHHETMNEQNRKWLQKNVVLDCPLLQAMERDQLIALFTLPQGFSAYRLIRTLIWQTMARLLCGDVKPPGGDIRSVWYAFVDPLFTRFDLYVKLHEDLDFQAYAKEYNASLPDEDKLTPPFEGVTSGYTEDKSEDALTDFVLQGIFKYSGPFAFPDKDAQYKAIGTKAAGLLFVVEKVGLYSVYCSHKEDSTGPDGFYEKYGISVMASQGNPSWLSVEYLADQLRHKGVTNLHLAALVDYDYGGWNISADYGHKLTAFGFKLKSHTNLTTLDLFSEDALAHNADDLSHEKTKGKQTQADAWFKLTNGIYGRKAGIHINLANPDLVRKAVHQWHKIHAPKSEGDRHGG